MPKIFSYARMYFFFAVSIISTPSGAMDESFPFGHPDEAFDLLISTPSSDLSAPRLPLPRKHNVETPCPFCGTMLKAYDACLHKKQCAKYFQECSRLMYAPAPGHMHETPQSVHQKSDRETVYEPAPKRARTAPNPLLATSPLLRQAPQKRTQKDVSHSQQTSSAMPPTPSEIFPLIESDRPVYEWLQAALKSAREYILQQRRTKSPETTIFY